MNHRNTDRIGLRPLLLAGALLVAGACGSNPVEPGDHVEPEGLAIQANGETLVTVDAANVVTGTLTVQAGEQSPRLTVTFVDHDGVPITFGDRYYLEVDVTGPAIAEFVHDAAGEFSGRVNGVTAGSTSFEFKLMHGSVGRGHLDYRSAPVPVSVTD